jgi:hypothetical protein
MDVRFWPILALHDFIDERLLLMKADVPNHEPLENETSGW